MDKNGKRIKNTDQIKKMLHDSVLKRSFTGLTDRSDIVVRGRFVSERNDYHYTFNVEEVYKGNKDLDSIIVAFMKVFGSQQCPKMWRQSLISAYTGYELEEGYILFLKSDQGIYYPFLGRNCVYQINSDDILITNRRLKGYKGRMLKEISGAIK